jgi:hypothetical protein
MKRFIEGENPSQSMLFPEQVRKCEQAEIKTLT